MIVHDLLEAAPFVAPIGAGVALLWLLGRGRDDQADEHTVDDYRPAQSVRRLVEPDAVVMYLNNRGATFAPHILPLAPVARDARAPLFAETLFRTWHPDAPGVVAGRMLREIAAEQQTKTGIRPAYATADRDLVGAFPVVRAA